MYWLLRQILNFASVNLKAFYKHCLKKVISILTIICTSLFIHKHFCQHWIGYSIFRTLVLSLLADNVFLTSTTTTTTKTTTTTTTTTTTLMWKKRRRWFYQSCNIPVVNFPLPIANNWIFLCSNVYQRFIQTLVV